MAARRKPKVVGIHGSVPACGQPVADVVEFLEELLKDARSGAITGIGAFWVGPAESLHTRWSGIADSNDLVSGATLLQHRIIIAKLRLDGYPEGE